MSLYTPASQSLASLPPELLLEIASRLLHPTTPMSFSHRMKTLATLSLITPSIHALLISSPVFWSDIQINVIRDTACCPPISFLRELFRRSGETKLSVRVVHWGDEQEDFNQDKRWGWMPGVMREIRTLLDDNEYRIQKLCLEFHHLNGTEYSNTGGGGTNRGCWRALTELEIYAHDWVTMRTLPMGWVESVVANASPETIMIRGSGEFGWSVLGKDMGRIRVLRVDTEIPQSLALEIISKATSMEECHLTRITQASQRQTSRTIKLLALRRLHVRAVGSFFNMITTPKLCELEVKFSETYNSTVWDREAFRWFVDRSGIGCQLRVVVERNATLQEMLKMDDSIPSFLMDVTE